MMSTKNWLFLLLCLQTLLITGCQPKVYLMPSPVGIQPESDFFNLSENTKFDNRLISLYATNREPHNLWNKKGGYTIFPSDVLRLGAVFHTVGDEGTTWEELYEKSLQQQRDKDLLIELEETYEIFQIDKDQSLLTISDSGKIFFDRINSILETMADKDITIYVHGANCNFYRATSQGAQYFHYTGHNSIVLTFSWPSAENILKYKTDVLHAEKTVPAFARLIELLALHSSAKNINIIAYSAGAQVAAPGLVYLREKYSEEEADVLKNRFRIGEVYFAAPDIQAESFAYRFLRFRDIVQRTTVSSNTNDSVLRLSALQTGKSRLGRPDFKDITEEEFQIFSSSSKTETFDILDIGGSTSLQVGGSHDFWYTHSWVSTDLLLLLLLNYPPEKRALVRSQGKNGGEVWHFPDDYEKRVELIRQELREINKLVD